MAHIDTPLMELIQTKGYSVHGLAEASDIPNSTLRRRLSDGDFTVTQLRRVAQTLGVTTTTVLALAEHSATDRTAA